MQVRRAIWLCAIYRLCYLRTFTISIGKEVSSETCVQYTCQCSKRIRTAVSDQTSRAHGAAGAAAAGTAPPRPEKEPLEARLLTSFLNLTSTPYRRGPCLTQ